MGFPHVPYFLFPGTDNPNLAWYHPPQFPVKIGKRKVAVPKGTDTEYMPLLLRIIQKDKAFPFVILLPEYNIKLRHTSPASFHNLFDLVIENTAGLIMSVFFRLTNRQAAFI